MTRCFVSGIHANFKIPSSRTQKARLASWGAISQTIKSLFILVHLMEQFKTWISLHRKWLSNLILLKSWSSKVMGRLPRTFAFVLKAWGSTQMVVTNLQLVQNSRSLLFVMLTRPVQKVSSYRLMESTWAISALCARSKSVRITSICFLQVKTTQSSCGTTRPWNQLVYWQAILI